MAQRLAHRTFVAVELRQVEKAIAEGGRRLDSLLQVDALPARTKRGAAEADGWQLHGTGSRSRFEKNRASAWAVISGRKEAAVLRPPARRRSRSSLCSSNRS